MRFRDVFLGVLAPRSHADAEAYARELLTGPIGRPENSDSRLANLCRAFLTLYWKQEIERDKP